ncbi:hypothetical protein T439DRAFT_332204 [Meredithblackwellia eburnea MCA 4105]
MSHPAHLRLVERQREYEAFLSINAQFKQFNHYLDNYKQQFNVLNNGALACAQVTEHWQSVFRTTHLALASLAAQEIPVEQQQQPTEEGQEREKSQQPKKTTVLPANARPDRIVRIPVDQSRSSWTPGEDEGEGINANVTPTQ